VEEEDKEEKKRMNLVATSVATQPVYNGARAAHALRSDQKSISSVIVNIFKS
jgi:hypothetical protein